MMKILKFKLICALLAMSAIQVMAQDGNGKEVKLDLLRAPSSPASSLLGFASAEIEKPTDLSDFMLSFQSANYAQLPSSYAIDLAPFYLLRKKGADFSTTGQNGLQNNSFRNRIRQSLVVSLAFRNPDSVFNSFKPGSTYGAAGLKVSVFRPQYTDDAIKQLEFIHQKQSALNRRVIRDLSAKQHASDNYRSLQLKGRKILDSIKDLPLTDKEKGKMVDKMLIDPTSALSVNNRAIEELNKEFSTDIAEQEMLALDSAAAEFSGNRQGFSMDIAGGVSAEFRDKRFDNSRVFNAGVWSTFGYNWANGSSILGLVRYLRNPDEVFALDNQLRDVADISTLDGGLRLIFLKGKFGGGAEAIYRSILTTSTTKPSWRLVANADYAVAANQKIIFSFGRNYDGTVTKDGNLIAALTLLLGFGTSR